MKRFIMELWLCGVLVIAYHFLQAQPARNIIDVTEYGILPHSSQNITPIIRKILKENTHAFTLQFPPGRYDFWPSHLEEKLFQAAVAFDLTRKTDVTIDGGGASFVFHGRMMPFKIEQAQNIQLKNFNIDWDRPFISQGRVVGVNDKWVDMEIDPKFYPYEITGDSIFFIGEGWRSPITKNYNNLYDPIKKEIVYQTRDNPLGALSGAKVSALGNNIVRFHFKLAYKPAIGTFVAMYHGAYITDGILLLNTKDTYLENIDIFHTLSCGVSGYRSENIHLKGVNILANETKGRVFSTLADATHFNGCKGLITIDGTTISGAGDDFTNVHGMYAPVTDVLDDTSVLVAPNGRYIGFDAGEVAWIVDTLDMQRKMEYRVKSQEPIKKGEQLIGYKITFELPHHFKIKKGNLLENKDRNPDVFIRNCHILKKNRARGALITTAGKVVIEHNYFNTAGAAILIEGDTDLWFESGATSDVLIRNNVFENCYTSGNNIVDAPWGWGEGVISITPSFRPKDNQQPYHRNIRIEQNVFKHFDYAILYARSVDGLTFTNNCLQHTHNYQPFYRKTNLFLDGCKNVQVSGNTFDASFLGKNITIWHMDKKDVSLTDQVMDIRLLKAN